ncbi:uncharacterized protein LOC133180841 [Saccostrea echinata]|uniref:uncharacterized protein LOC133180841 n=1 Tax=Saccostrea echinata TaxID=191078 RepID=UPI002A829E35|nr:uncharacterized protein LOC133180841 [Saccostrea echinata]
MLKFSVSHRQLPLHYLRQTMTPKPASKQIGNMEGRKERNSTTISSSYCEIYQQSPCKSAVVLWRNSPTPRKKLSPTKRRSGLIQPEVIPRRRSPLKRTETMQMKVWSSQLHRLKRKTESLRKKDNEIKEKFLEIRRKAKRVVSATGFSLTDSEDDATPTKRAKMTTSVKDRSVKMMTKDIKIEFSAKLQANKHAWAYEDPCVLPRKVKRVSDEIMDVNQMYSSHLLDVPKRRYKMPQKRHRSGSDIPSGSGNDVTSLFPIPFPRTFLKHGKKCTNC